jgi:hypothetical protein
MRINLVPGRGYSRELGPYGVREVKEVSVMAME